MNVRAGIRLGMIALACGLAPERLAAQGTANPHGATIQACAACHAPDSWKPVRTGGTFRHAETTFPLDGAHLRSTCTSCHKSLVFKQVKTGCASCHSDVHSGEVGTDCARCHTTRSFVDLERMRRVHEMTRFPLRGAHATAQCVSCHAPSKPGQAQFTNRPTTCASCHIDNYRLAKSPDHQASQFSLDCSSCHTVATWAGGKFDHSTTKFPLENAHRAATCASCHADKVFVGKPTACASCHMPDFNRSAKPPHASAGFPTACATCHDTKAWKGAPFDHATTQFPLTGAHRAAICTDCHSDNVYKGKPTTCVSCHQSNYAKSALPPHSALGFSSACATCHTTAAWRPGTFDHATTRFPLTGSHLTATCTGCHADGVYRGKPTTCSSCHQSDAAKAVTPPHAGFPSACESCHQTTTWKGARFDHSTTRFPLVGVHKTAVCASCHADGVFKGKPMTCVSCHQADLAKAVTPSHTTFPTTCESCHSPAGWKGAGFDHSTTQFPLTGAHRATVCTACHGDGVYRGKPTACVSCHQSNYNAAALPPHSSLGFPTTCLTCHNTIGWQPATFDHNATNFPLAGAHRTALCTACHADGVYKGKPTTCISCHQAKYNAASIPPHSALGFSAVCTTCHSTTAWQPASFDHAATRFPLTGAHRAATCANCHADGVYRGKSMLCSSCHLASYSATKSPAHAAASFPTTCETCHTTTAWTPATFNHSGTRFPLTGAHVSTTCSACHGDGVYRGKPLVCSGCHLSKYTATTNPSHAAAGFPTTCESCHNTTTWLGATFNHDASFFPIYSGAHKGRWSTCANCHPSPSSFAAFTCTSCHAKAVTDSHHQGKAGYSYDSARCYSCHPRGKAG